MTTELTLQKNSISQNQSNPKAKNAPKSVDYSKYQLGAKAYSPKGYLVNTPLWKAPFVMVGDTFENVKNLGKGLKGKSDDHKLGQTNNLGMQGAGLAIAGYLASTKVLPVKKGMEFVGFASFLASMALFPTLFIQAPIQALYGFNINQKYVDSYGRKKDVHRDPQYTPWDLYPSEKLSSVGDRMGIDKNMTNRQSVIKEKMTKISIQADTLWMLTAGIAVPAMSALISCAAEKGMHHINKVLKTNQVNKKINDLSSITEADKKETEKLEAFLKENTNKSLNEKSANDLVKLIAGNDDERIHESFKADLKELLKSEKTTDVSEMFGDVKLEIPHPDNKDAKVNVEIKKEEIKAALEAKQLNKDIALFGEKNEPQRKAVANVINTLYKEKAVQQSEAFKTDRSVREALDTHFQTVLSSKLDTEPLHLSKEKAEMLKNVHKEFSIFRQKDKVLKEYVIHKTGLNEGSVGALEWAKASNGIFKALGFKDAEIKKMQESESQARKILEAKFEEIVKNDEKYKETVKKIANLVKHYETEIEKGSEEKAHFFKSEAEESSKGKKSFLQTVTEKTHEIYGNLSEKLYGIDSQAFRKTTNQLNNLSEAKHLPGKQELFKKSTSYAIVYDAKNSLIGAKSSLNKILHGLDLFKRIQSGDVENALKNRSENYTKEFGKKIISNMKYILMEGDIGVHTVKIDIPQKEVYKDTMTLLFNIDKNNTDPKLIKFISDAKREEIENGIKKDIKKQLENEARNEIENEVKLRRKDDLEKAADNDAKDKLNKEIKDESNKIFNEKEKELKIKIEKEQAEAIKKATEPEGKITTGIADAIKKYKDGLFDSADLHKFTKEALKETKLSPEEFKSNLIPIFTQFCDGHYRFKDEHGSFNKDTWGAEFFGKIKDKLKGIEETVLTKQNMSGENLSNFAYKESSKKYNTRAWLKMVGGAGAAVGAITLLAPFFFGKLKHPHTANQEGSTNG